MTIISTKPNYAKSLPTLAPEFSFFYYRPMKTAVLLSGGVDSSVALRLLQEEGGQEITAYYLKIWLEDELSYLGSCPWEEDLAYAQGVCDQAGVTLKVLNLQTEYFERVVSYTLEELKAGRTPSPDIFCNQRVKFGAFWEKVHEHYDRVATGHYAQVGLVDGRAALLRAPDPVKDQTYFLSHLSQQQVSKIVFPLGHLMKKEVREKAKAWDLPNKDRPDSQGICFLGKIKYNDFVKHYLGEKPGPIMEKETGKLLGTHKGFWFHTIGQRSGLGLSGGPWFVVKKDCDCNIVYVSHQENQESVNRRDFRAVNLTWIRRAMEDGESGLVCKLRHGPDLIPCSAEYTPEGSLNVILDRPDKGIAPGQFVVFYQGEECLGSGRIEV